MQTHEMEITIPEDHRLVVEIPETIHSGPAKLILLLPAEGGTAPGQRLRLKDLPKRDGLNCTFDELVATSWEQEWNPDP
jgi:hypothetical protein